MEKRFLIRSRLNEFLDALRLFGELHGPTVSRAGVTAFAPLADLSLLALEYSRTQIPPKKYLIPFREEILRYRDGGYSAPPPDAPDVVLFGVHPCDLDGIAYLDLVFAGERPDPCYAARRARLTLIGISCEPDDFCFCSGSRDAAPCDLFLRSAADGFEISIGSAKGEAIAEAARHLLEPAPSLPAASPAPSPIATQDPASFKLSRPLSPANVPAPGGGGLGRGNPAGSSEKPTPSPLPTSPRWGEESLMQEGRAPNLTAVPQDPASRFSDNPLWDSFAARCVSCGACSVCCPTCYCFDVREYPNLAGGATRLREWDNCLFVKHGEVAGGANFRATRLERLRYRFLHKYCGFTPLDGMTSCVGCGRCKQVCPVDIDLRELFQNRPEPETRQP